MKTARIHKTTINIVLDRKRMLCMHFEAKKTSYAAIILRDFEQIQRNLDEIKSLPVENRLIRARYLSSRKKMALEALKDASVSYHYMRFKGE